MATHITVGFKYKKINEGLNNAGINKYRESIIIVLANRNTFLSLDVFDKRK